MAGRVVDGKRKKTLVVKGRGRFVDGGKTKRKRPVFMCMICGFMSPGVLPVKCPVCGAGKENFRKVSRQ